MREGYCQEILVSGFHSHQCSRKGVVNEVGKMWCRQHAPSAVRKRNNARNARYERESTIRQAWWRVERAQTVLCNLIREHGIDEALLDSAYQELLAADAALGEARKSLQL